MEIRRTYDRVAPAYQEAVGGELAAKPLDRAILTGFVELAGAGPVADVGCGPGHVTRFLVGAGAAVLGLDLSPGMIAVARDRSPGLPFAVASMLGLPLADGACAGVAALYSIIHLDPDERAAAFAEFARVLRPGGPLLLAFHVDTADHPAGTTTHLTEWFGSRVDIGVHFLDPAVVAAELAAAGLTVTASVVRRPLPAAEYPSRRAYLIAQSSAGTLPGSSGPGIGSTGAGGNVSGVSGESSPGSSGIGSLGSIGG